MRRDTGTAHEPPAPLSSIGGEVFQAGPVGIEVLHTAGHTPESVCYHCETAVACFVGDALFSGSVGGTASDRLHRELVDNLGTRIVTLPEETELLPSDGPVTTVRIEKTAIPVLPGRLRSQRMTALLRRRVRSRSQHGLPWREILLGSCRSRGRG